MCPLQTSNYPGLIVAHQNFEGTFPSKTARLEVLLQLLPLVGLLTVSRAPVPGPLACATAAAGDTAPGPNVEGSQPLVPNAEGSQPLVLVFRIGWMFFVDIICVCGSF